ncbi:MAG TPA: hypothetical protein VI814_11185, partial [Candidatus Limnocylindria bacterium]
VADDTGDRHMPARSGMRRAALAIAMLAAYVAVLATPAARTIFDLVPPSVPEVALVAGAGAAWIVALRWLLRVRALDAALGVRTSA